MKKLFLAVAILSLSVLCRAQSVVQCANNQGAANTAITVTLAATTSGNAIVIMSGQGVNNTSTLAITDSASQSGWVQTASGYSSANTSSRSAMFFRPNSASITTVTATWSGSLSTTVTAIACEISSVASSSAEDSSVNSNNNAAGTTATSGSLTTTNANDILIFSFRTGGDMTASSCVAGSGYAIPTNANDSSPNTRECLQTKTVTATQSAVTTTTTWTTSQTYASVFLALKQSGGAAATPTINKARKLEALEGGQ